MAKTDQPNIIELSGYLSEVVVRATGSSSAPVAGGNADTVDGFHASATALANTLLALDGSAKLPADITGDADTVDGYEGAELGALAEAETVTGLWTFSRGSDPPFACVSGAAMVDYLDADKLDGYEGAELGALAEAETVTGVWDFGNGLTVGSDVGLSRGAADRLDLGAGDSLRIPSDGQLQFGSDVVVARVGSDQLGFYDDISSEDFVSQLTGWRMTNAGALDCREIYSDELHVKAFIADIEQALAGGQIISKSVAILSRDFTVPSNTNSATLYVEDLPGFPNTAVFAANDYIRLRVIDRSGGGLVVADVWGQVTSYSDLSGGEQSWTFTTTDDGGQSGETVYGGAIALDYGSSGDGYWEVTTLDTDSPYSQIVTWATNPWTAGNLTLRVRMGNLDGVTDADLNPSGWGLYASNVFLKGDLVAGGGVAGANADGFWINAPSSSPQDKHAYKVYDSTGTTLKAWFGPQEVSGVDSGDGYYAQVGSGADNVLLVSSRGNAGGTATAKVSMQAIAYKAGDVFPRISVLAVKSDRAASSPDGMRAWATVQSFGICPLDGDSADDKVRLDYDGDIRCEGGLYVGSIGTDPAPGTITATDYICALGGLHVGGTSDPGTDKLVVDSNTRISGGLFLGATGAAPDEAGHLMLFKASGVYGSSHPYLSFRYGSTRILDTYMDGSYAIHFDAPYANSEFVWDVAGSRAASLFSGAKMVIGTATAASSKATGPSLTINQGADDGPILAFQSSDVDTGITTYYDTRSYGVCKKNSGGSGGLEIDGVTEDVYALVLSGAGTNNDNTQSTSSAGTVAIAGFLKSGTGLTSPTSSENILVVRGGVYTRFIFKATGKLYVDSTYESFDEYDDCALVRAISRETAPEQVVESQFDRFVQYNRGLLEETGLVTFNEDGHNFVDVTGMSKLHSGAIWQLYTEKEAMKEEIAALREQVQTLQQEA